MFDLTLWQYVMLDDPNYYVALPAQAVDIQSWQVPAGLLDEGHLYEVVIGASNDWGLTWGDWLHFHLGNYTPALAPVIKPPDQWTPAGNWDDDTGCRWVAQSACTFPWSYVSNDDGTVPRAHYDETDFYVWLRDLTTGEDIYGDGVFGQPYGNWDNFNWTTPQLSAEHRYSFRVAAATENGRGPWSDPVLFAAVDTNPPQDPPVITQIGYGPWVEAPYGGWCYANAPALPQITWTAVAGATYYDVCLYDRTDGYFIIPSDDAGHGLSVSGDLLVAIHAFTAGCATVFA